MAMPAFVATSLKSAKSQASAIAERHGECEVQELKPVKPFRGRAIYIVNGFLPEGSVFHGGKAYYPTGRCWYFSR